MRGLRFGIVHYGFCLLWRGQTEILAWVHGMALHLYVAKAAGIRAFIGVLAVGRGLHGVAASNADAK